MLKNKLSELALIPALVLSIHSAAAQSGPASGLYKIISGSYSACCGIAGNDFGYDLPNENQKFVRFTLDQLRQVATLTFLAEDCRTVFSTVPCLPSGAINFNFDYGLVFSNYTVFHVDPGPPPYRMYWNYTVSNSANSLRIDGLLATIGSLCADVPTRFSHSNVVAVLVPGPILSVLGVSTNRATRVMARGNPGWTDVIEASTNLVDWTPVSTNFMDFSLCPICPFVIFEDPASTNLPYRFYRASEVP